VIAREAVREMKHGSGVDVKLLANPVRMSETPTDYRLPPPMLGEHTDEVLSARLGLDAAKLAKLRADGII
jgi:crotonobetainyl-CoA:carnitine CoA-transferase CaiB-like acyl-CoA transferase